MEPHPSRPRPTLEAVRETIAARLDLAPRFRQRLAFPPPPFDEPFWVDDTDFDLSRHVLSLTGPEEPVTLASFQALTDAALSAPLDKKRPLWQFLLVPRLEDGRIGMISKLHHAMVDGIAAVEFATLVFDSSPDAPQQFDDREWTPSAPPGRLQLALQAAADSTTDVAQMARGAIALTTSPRRQAVRAAETLKRVAAVVRNDLLTLAPDSPVNVRIGPQRTLVRFQADMADIRRAKRRAQLEASDDHVTINDVYLAAVAGALRTLALRRGEAPQPLKVMVPVNLRGEDDDPGGNRISFCFVELPVHVSTAAARLRRVHEATTAFKRSHRSDGSNAVLSALGMLPSPLKSLAARLAASPRTYNVTISNIPGPELPLYMLGARLQEAYPVVPLSEDHALSVGVFGYVGHAHFGFYADPGALPDVRDLPAATSAEIRALAGPRKRPRRERIGVENGDLEAERATVTPLR